MDTLLFSLATGFGLGLSPWIPGTIGALLGVPIVLLSARLAWWKQLVVVLLLCLVSGVVCELAQTSIGADDPGQVVADEYLTLPVATVGLPVTKHPVLLATIFVVSRLLDYVKPPPARLMESVPGGAGMVLDDIITNCYALLLGWAFFIYALRGRSD
jgi:phosphatidylglycerophosphatase A